MDDLGEGPRGFTLFNRRVVLWRSPSGSPAAAEDRCCHRSAPLSMGRVVDGNLRCPYHGWTFDGEGRCVLIPQRPGRDIPTDCRVASYRCAERYGYAWICLGEPLAEIPEIDEALDPSYRAIHMEPSIWSCNGLVAMENFFDNGHHHFVHHHTLGDRGNPAPPVSEVLEETRSGLFFKSTLWNYNNDLQRGSWGVEAEQFPIVREFTWFLPFTAKLSMRLPSGVRQITVLSFAPVTDGSSHVAGFVLRSDTEEEASSEDVLAWSRTVSLEDKVMLESLDEDTPLDISEQRHTVTDQPGIRMRRRLAALLREHGEQERRRDATAAGTAGGVRSRP